MPPRIGPAHWNRRRACGCPAIASLAAKGELRWMLLDGALKVPSLTRFPWHLARDAGRKAFLASDNLFVRRARAVQDEPSGRQAEVEIL